MGFDYCHYIQCVWGQSPSTIQQEFATQELCIQAAKEIVPKLNDEGYVKIAKCVFTGVRK